jgi:hypothetical protein
MNPVLKAKDQPSSLAVQIVGVLLQNCCGILGFWRRWTPVKDGSRRNDQLQVMLGFSLANSKHALCCLARRAVSPKLSCCEITCVVCVADPTWTLLCW